MVTINDAVIARMKKEGKNFEILVDCESALAVRSGKSNDVRGALAAVDVFSDANKGLKASENEMKHLFGTFDVLEVAELIMQKGDLQLTQEYRQKLRDDKKRQIIGIIHRNGVDPKTHSPHPVNRIEAAFEEAKFHVDEFHNVNDQVQEALKKLRPILPIKFEIKEIEIKITAEYAMKCYAVVKQFGTILKEHWTDSGMWDAVVEIPGGVEMDMFDRLNKIAHGNIESKVVRVK
jgi:ribosome maturation protein SDO1